MGERWMNVCATPEERQAVVERIRAVLQEERGVEEGELRGGRRGGKVFIRLGRSRIMVEGTKEEGRAGGGVLARACIQAWTANDGLICLAQPFVKREASVLRCCVRVLCRCVPCTLFLTFPGGEKRY